SLGLSGFSDSQGRVHPDLAKMNLVARQLEFDPAPRSPEQSR
ncbi:MAG: hypothetical protein JWN04_5337, partial [Myxococcaceae bacterium]|nr:hypothetical protein [Myxococcaceae bacterium]